MVRLSQIAGGKGSAPAKPKPAPSGGQGYTRTRQTGSNRPTKEEEAEVTLMQTIMVSLATAIMKNPNGFISGVNSKSSENKINTLYTDSLKTAIAKVGSQGRATDGIWGQDTIAALKMLNKLAIEVGTSQITPGKVYSSTDSGSVIQLAKKNVEAISEFMRGIGFGGAVPAGIGGDVYDMIERTLNNETLDPRNPSGNNVVTSNSFDNLWTFYDFVVDLFGLKKAASNKDYMIKLANHINSSNLYKISQEAQEVDGAFGVNYNGSSDSSFESRIPSGRLTVSQLDDTLSWFSDRAELVYKWTDMNLSRGTTKPDGSRWTEKDLDLAKKYMMSVRGLVRDWAPQSRDLIDNSDKTDPAEIYVDPMDLNGNSGSVDYSGRDSGRKVELESDTGSGYGRSRQGDTDQASIYGGRDGFTIKDTDGREWTTNGPLSNRLNLEDLRGQISPSLQEWQWLESNVDNLEFIYDNLRSTGGSVEGIYDRRSEMSRQSRMGKGRFANGVYSGILRVVNDLYNSWHRAASTIIRDVPEPLRDDISEAMARQARFYNAWRSLAHRRVAQSERYKGTYPLPY